VIAILAGAVAYITLTRAAAQRAGEGVTPTVPVVVAATQIKVRTQLTADVLETVEMPVDVVPIGAVGAVRDATGMLTTVDLYPGEVLLQRRLLDPNVIAPDGRLAMVLVEDEVLMAFPAGDLMSQIGVLKAGDHVDLLFSLDVPVGAALGGPSFGGDQTEQMTFNLLENITIAAVVGGPTGTGGREDTKPIALLLTVSPQDALVLKYVKDAGGIPDIVLRPPGVEGPYETEPVDIDYVIDRYQIPTETGR
jgi:pilus assembly protein CpaB